MINSTDTLHTAVQECGSESIWGEQGERDPTPYQTHCYSFTWKDSCSFILTRGI